MLLMSENDDDDDDSGSATNLNLLTDHDTQSVLPDILKEDAERIRAQIGADIDSERTPARLTLFNDDAHTHVAPVSNDERAGAFATTFDGNDPVEQVFANTSATYNLHSILRHALKSDWIVVQAKLGWKLTQTIGDMLLRTMCLEPDRGVAHHSLARAATLPSQIALRVVSEMMLDGMLPFRVDSSVDYSQLEAAVGLLSNMLDSVQAMHDVRDVSRSIYQRLCAINQRISDGITDNIDKTLAKDAVQTLVVRLFMTAISDSAERLNPVYSSARPLDSWLNMT
ncbi:hypothetical protein GGI10_003338 [Coemansia sp. RSA 2530]|nr:hypothetical protein GGI10_003338 [Coemansia sp. RSA 2530]